MSPTPTLNIYLFEGPIPFDSKNYYTFQNNYIFANKSDNESPCIRNLQVFIYFFLDKF
jgi:hypothetical protein